MIHNYFSFCWFSFLITRAGFPARQSAGISLVTTEPAPITVRSPMVTPRTDRCMTAYPASFADGDWFAVFPFVSFISIKRVLSGVYICTPGAIMVWAPMVTLAPSRDNSSEINENAISSIDVVASHNGKEVLHGSFCSVWTEFTNNILKFICINTLLR